MNRGLKELISRACDGIHLDQYCDIHIHLVGQESIGANSFWKRFLYQKAFHLKSLNNLAEESVSFLESLVFNEGKYGLLAIDQVYDERGALHPEKTYFYVSNETIFNLVKRSPNFFPIPSIHPYRKDACELLELYAQRGIRMIKWLPNEMSLDPSHRLCLPFYKKMARYHMALLSHTGKESAVPSHQQAYGNPLLLRKALDEGVTVIMAHCGTSGKGQDLEDPQKKWVSNFDLFLRMAKQDVYKKLLFGDLAAVVQINRCHFLPKLLELTQPGFPLHGRIMQGSDYPLTNISYVTSPTLLAIKGMLTMKEASLLNKIYKINPLLFDFVIKRTIRHPRTKVQFPPELFMKHQTLKQIL